MKGGIVSTIRINPTDAQSILDVLEKAGVRTAGMSFAAMTALAMSSLLESARRDKIIPEPDPFQYLNRIGPYIKAKHSRKLQVTAVLHNAGATLQAPPIAASIPEPMPEAAVRRVYPATAPATVPEAPVAPVAEVDPEELRWATNRLTELLAKKDSIDAGVPGLQWTDPDTEEFQRVFAIVYPDG